MILKQLILLCIGGGLLLLAVRRLSQYRLKERYTLGFLFIGLPFMALALWPNAMGRLGGLLGIDYRTLMLLSVTAFFLLMVLELLTIVSLQDRKITALAQTLGLVMQEQQALRRAPGASANLTRAESTPESERATTDQGDAVSEPGSA
jgi:hypothetical protein